MIVSVMGSIGILNLPDAIALVGWAGLALVPACGLISMYTARLLIASLHASEDGKRITSYPALGEVAFGPPGRVATRFFQNVTLLGVAALTLMVAGTYLVEGIGGKPGQGVLPTLSQSWPTDCDDEHDDFACEEHVWYQRWTALVALVALILLINMPTLGEARSIALLGAVAFVLSALLVTAATLSLYPMSADKAAQYDLPWANATERKLSRLPPRAGPLAPFALCLSSVTLSFGGHSVLVAVEGHTIQTWRFERALHRAYVVLVSLQTMVSFSGYLTFGEQARSPILSNLPPRTTSGLGCLSAV